MQTSRSFSSAIAIALLGTGISRSATAQEQIKLSENYAVSHTQGVLGAYDDLASTPNFMGFYKGNFDIPLGGTHHWQAIARPYTGGRPLLYLTRSGKLDGTAAERAKIDIVSFSSRLTGPSQMRSNKLVKGVRTPQTPPDVQDRVVKEIDITDYEHAGGMQICGNYLAVALENPGDPNDPKATIRIYDISDPISPVELPNAGIDQPDNPAGVVALTRLIDGHYFLCMSWGKNRTVRFYRSNTTSLEDPSLDWGNPLDELSDDELPEGWPNPTLAWETAYQTLNFVHDSDGGLFLLGARNFSEANGANYIGAYRVTIESGEVTLTSERRDEDKQWFCEVVNAEGRECNFQAATGSYVTPSGSLIFYGAEHLDGGPQGTVRLAEFVPKMDMTADLASIRLFEDDDQSGYSLVVDLTDQVLDDYQDFEELDGDDIVPYGFNDRVNSVLWHAPIGTSIVLYEDDTYRKPMEQLNGAWTAGNPVWDWHNIAPNKLSSLLFLGTGCAGGNGDVWVCNGGTNVNCGIIPGRPFQSFRNKALPLVGSGRTIHLYAGLYQSESGPLTVNQNLTLTPEMGVVVIRQ